MIRTLTRLDGDLEREKDRPISGLSNHFRPNLFTILKARVGIATVGMDRLQSNFQQLQWLLQCDIRRSSGQYRHYVDISCQKQARGGRGTKILLVPFHNPFMGLKIRRRIIQLSPKITIKYKPFEDCCFLLKTNMSNYRTTIKGQSTKNGINQQSSKKLGDFSHKLPLLDYNNSKV